jgi:ketosteroid isomerase-like protein
MRSSLGIWRRVALAGACVAAAQVAVPGAVLGQDAAAAARTAVDALNAKNVKACQEMDNAASASLWADDGVDLIQGLAPMVGKTTITTWLNGLTPGLKGAKMVYCTIDWKQVTVVGDWAYEWGVNRQRIEFRSPQPPFESEGKITLVLKRQPNGEWKIELESWNSSPGAAD